MINLDITFLRKLHGIWMHIKSLVISSSQSGILLPILICLNLSITLFLSANLNIDGDEVYSLDTTGKDIGYALHQALYVEQQSPLYFILLNLWRSLNSSIFFARLFSILCIALAIYVVAGVSRRFLKDIHPCWVTASVAFNPFVIWAAVEIRLYAFTILLSALLLLSFFDGYLTKVPQTKARWFYVAFSVLAIYTQYYIVFLLVANAVALLVLRRWHAFRNYLFGTIIVGLCFAPMLLIIPEQLSDVTQAQGVVPSVYPQTITIRDYLFNGFKYMLQRVLYYIFPGSKTTSLTASLKIVFVPTLCIVLVYFMKEIRRSITAKDIAILTIAFTLFLSFLTLSILISPGLVEHRHTASFFLPVMLSVFVAVKGIPKRNALFIWIIVTIFYYSTSLYVIYKPMAKSGDWERIASYIMTAEKPHQDILAFTPEVAVILGYYYSGPNAIVPIPQKQNFQTYNLHDFVLKDEKQILTALSGVPVEHQFLWLVQYATTADSADSYNNWILEKFISKYYVVESSRNFFESKVRLLHWKSIS